LAGTPGISNMMGKYIDIKTGIGRKCLECGKSFRVYPYEIRLGYGKFCGRHCRSKYRVKTPLGKRIIEHFKNLPRLRGAEAPGWKGGVSPENEKQRKSIQFRLWREAVFARDNWTCQECGKRCNEELHPHHIKSFAEYPELRFALDNGITLCKQCHRERHKDDARVWQSWSVVSRKKNANHFEYGE